MSNEVRTIQEQISLLRERGMEIDNENEAVFYLEHISYFRLKGYWWDMQSDQEAHTIRAGSRFSEVIARYFFDRELRDIFFDAIESIEVALRTKMIYYPSLKYGRCYYRDETCFDNNECHKRCLERIENEFQRSNEVFVQKFKNEYGVDECGRLSEYPPAWLIFEVATFGTLSMMYKNMAHQLPEKLLIARDFGFNNQREFSGALESVSYIRNIVAHHSRIWGRDVVKYPPLIKNPRHVWLRSQPDLIRRKPFIAITVVLYLCNAISMRNTVGAADAGESYKKRIIALVEKKEQLAIQGWGFPVDWRSEPIWGGNE